MRRSSGPGIGSRSSRKGRKRQARLGRGSGSDPGQTPACASRSVGRASVSERATPSGLGLASALHPASPQASVSVSGPQSGSPRAWVSDRLPTSVSPSRSAGVRPRGRRRAAGAFRGRATSGGGAAFARWARLPALMQCSPANVPLATTDWSRCRPRPMVARRSAKDGDERTASADWRALRWPDREP